MSSAAAKPSSPAITVITVSITISFVDFFIAFHLISRIFGSFTPVSISGLHNIVRFFFEQLRGFSSLRIQRASLMASVPEGCPPPRSIRTLPASAFSCRFLVRQAPSGILDPSGFAYYYYSKTRSYSGYIVSFLRVFLYNLIFLQAPDCPPAVSPGRKAARHGS